MKYAIQQLAYALTVFLLCGAFLMVGVQALPGQGCSLIP